LCFVTKLKKKIQSTAQRKGTKKNEFKMWWAPKREIIKNTTSNVFLCVLIFVFIFNLLFKVMGGGG